MTTGTMAATATTMVVETQGDEAVVRVVGHLTVANWKEFHQHVTDALARGARRVVVDLGAAGYVDSSGLGTLVLLARGARAQERELRLANLNEDVRIVFALTKLDTLFGIGTGAPAAA